MKKKYAGLEIVLTYLLECDIITFSASDAQGENDLVKDDVFVD